MAEIKVKIEIQWGKKWNGRHYEETKGAGAYVTCMETQGNHFKGCPLGRVDGYADDAEELTGLIEAAIADFIRYGRVEYTGQGALTRDKIEIVSTRDFR